MSAVGTFLVTGASGFIGSHIVSAALDRKHRVRALARRSTTRTAGADFVSLDLGGVDAPAVLDRALEDVDVVIHVAAALGGDDRRHARDTVLATETLIAAMLRRNAAVGQPSGLVLASSMAVYDGQRTPEGGVVDENAPLEARPEDRDGYCRAKLAQERLARRAADEGLCVWVLRPGAVFGPRRLGNAHLGIAFGPVLIGGAAGGEVPVCAVGRCAEVFVLAAESAATAGGGLEIINVLDDDRPDRARFVAAMRASGWPRLVVPCSWRVFAASAQFAEATAKMLPPLRRRLPGLLRPAVAHARLKPVRYDINYLRTSFAPKAQPSFEHAMRNAIAAASEPTQ